MKNKAKRFIAGAICPSCETMDTLILFEVDDMKTFQCVACDYQEKISDKEKGPGKENETSSGASLKNVKPKNIIQWLSVDGD